MISIIIPSYNATRELYNLIKNIKKNLTVSKYEIIIVEDFSTNKNKNLFRLLEKERAVKIFYLKKNLGQHRAVVYGLKKSKGNYIFTLDDDMQHDPKLMKKMILLSKKSNLIYAYPNNMTRGYLRYIFVKSMKLILINIFFIKEFNFVSDYRLFNKKLINLQLQNNILKKNLNLDLILNKRVRKNPLVISYKEKKRKVGSSNYNFFKLIMYTWCIIKTKINLLFNDVF